MDIERIKSIALEFREAIERTPMQVRPFTFKDFPLGCCNDSAHLLGTYLINLGLGEFECVSGERGIREDNTWTTHGWLECGSLIVDIAADQFDDAPAAVIVSTDSAFHRTFEELENQRRSAHLDATGGPYIPELWRFYHYLTTAKN